MRAPDRPRAAWTSADDYPGLASDWMALEARSECSPFASWLWVSTWLELLPAHIKPSVFSAEDGNGLLALGLLVEVQERGAKRIFGHRSFHLQETGRKSVDEITIEYSGLLARRGDESLAYACFLDELAGMRRDWRRTRIPATEHRHLICANLPRSLRAMCVRSQPSYFVDLGSLRSSGTPYLETLSKKTRGNLQRIRRAYQAHGDIRVEVAGQADQALDWLDHLRVLHQRHWASRDLEGAFTSRFFDAFHSRLVVDGTWSGLTRITRVSAGGRAIGYLYNLAWRGTLYYYNAGLNYGMLERYDNPGLLSLLAVIEDSIGNGYDAYDFLAGDQDYKRRLATASRHLNWIDLRPASLRFTMERVAALMLGNKDGIGLPIVTTSGLARCFPTC